MENVLIEKGLKENHCEDAELWKLRTKHLEWKRTHSTIMGELELIQIIIGRNVRTSLLD